MHDIELPTTTLNDGGMGRLATSNNKLNKKFRTTQPQSDLGKKLVVYIHFSLFLTISEKT